MRKGVILQDDFNMVIRNGSFWPEPSGVTESRLIMSASPSCFRWAPEIGVNMENMLLDDTEPDEVESVIQEQHALDGLTVTDITPTAEGFLIEFTEDEEDN